MYAFLCKRRIPCLTDGKLRHYNWKNFESGAQFFTREGGGNDEITTSRSGKAFH